MLLIVVATLLLQLQLNNARQQVGQSIKIERAVSELNTQLVNSAASKMGYLLRAESWLLDQFGEGTGRSAQLSAQIDSLQSTLGPTGLPVVEAIRAVDSVVSQYREELEAIERGQADSVGLSYDNPELQQRIRGAYYQLTYLRLNLHELVDARRSRVRRLFQYQVGLGVLGVIAMGVLFFRIYTGLEPYARRLRETNRRLEEEQSRREQLITTLTEKNLDLDHFAFIASHDLQEPLRTISNFIEVFREEYGSQLDERAEGYFGFITRATDRMSALIHNLLRFGRLGHNTQLERVDLEKVVDEVLEALSLRIAESKARVDRRSPLPVVNGYRIELQQLLQNLITNALKFTRPGEPPRISLYCVTSEREYRISVEDQGIGISEDDQRKIFRMFSRINQPGAYTGEGIGLAFCRKIVELHGGILFVDSTVNMGSTFTFSLPRTTVATNEEEISENSTDR